MRRAALLILLCAPAASGLTPDERTLARHGLEPTRASIGKYLRSLRPDDAQRTRIDSLIAQLASRVPAERDHAARELMRLGSAAVVALERAARHEEPEVRRQATLLLEATDSRQTAEVLYAVFRVIRSRAITGLATEVMLVIPVAADAHVRREARGALVVTARPEDLGLLLHSAAEGDPITRMACFAALRKLGGKKAIPVLRAALGSDSDRVRLAAAFELANLGERESLPALIDLLDAPDEWIRFRAVATLRSIAQRSHGYVAGVAAAQRAPAVIRWRKWLADGGAKAEWQTPLRWFTTHRGRTLVAIYGGGKVVEFDDEGNVVWTVEGLSNPWAVRGLPSGHRLISSYSGKLIYEYDARGERVWQSDRLPGNIGGIDQLANGNIIAAVGTTQGQLLEISRAKKIVWKLPLDGRPVSVRALAGGNLLVALYDAGSVVEIDRVGRVQWRVKGIKQPYSADRLPNGNVLVACYGDQRIAEFDRDGALVWEQRNIAGVYSAERLADGSLLYADKAAVHCLRPDGKPLWSKPLPGNYLYIDRY